MDAGYSDESREEGERKHHPQSTLFLLDAQKENIMASPHKQENRKSTDNDSVSGATYIPESTDNYKKSPFIHRLLLEPSCVYCLIELFAAVNITCSLFNNTEQQ